MLLVFGFNLEVLLPASTGHNLVDSFHLLDLEF